MRHSSRYLLTTFAAVGTLVLAACGGGSSDTVGGSTDTSSGPALTLVGYAVPKNGWDAIAPAFAATEDGDGTSINADYGASGNQSRKVADGAPADIVNFSVEPDVTRLVKAGKVDEDWNQNAYGGVPFGSVVTLVVREGNPKNIQTWDDLLKPDVQVISPSPLSSGSAKWNLLAPYAAKSNGGQDKQAGLDYVQQLVSGHFPVQPESGRAATEAFLQGQGDVLISYENEALLIEEQGQPVEHVDVADTFRIDNPVAVVNTSAQLDRANALNDFVYTDEGQRIWAEEGFRPTNPEIAAEFTDKFFTPATLRTIDDLGGWEAVDAELFGDNGAITTIYKENTQ
ncbi:sulfate ABC transporter substrate-binding protein [Rhodococcus sp. BP-252]|uniref:sulfate ABC transporter substrate-binding protein n=1 Tax=unclassified Rhodococcus (in: high G+C Gram-positive bacteria) TaxID=192944 RepID=UPI0014312CBF|nr:MULTISPECIES: sulfate ABC transporter substrate-binding protein [unclassified Rhodococcus (in: high G+C Gram-positive bacteria)]MBY6412046.1 sulfate ABC transporter substrate-binding protein [Rhodococcus sp. BP-320]MBY6416626.1 sulfate ABC transporter substrate-binding protein [Rhodococcus sp. BP-321]MBY6421185.1 sulfate ABC transporter substrate-binding protein [Rhodococcus sp. BP-324]MBY6426650.1 sulfate ABC transporter substrate-binding protein [Rhodococcus sp. BP-323]MBY6431649.1 sulfat